MDSARMQPDDSGAARLGEAGCRAGRKPEAIVVAAPALLAAGLCLIQIRGRSLGFDEAASVAIANQHGSALRSAIAHDGGNMSGYYVLLHALVDLFGDGPLALRLPSAFGAGLAAALTGLLGLRLFDRRVALVSGLLTAVSLSLVFWGQSARSYALLVALSAGSFLAFSGLIEGRRPRLAWPAYVICTALALYASLMAILIVAAQLVSLVWHRRKLRAVSAAIGAIAVCCVPLMILAARRGSGQLFWVPRPNWTAVKQVAEALTSAGLQPTFHTTSTTYALMALTIVVLVLVAAAVVAERSWPPLLVLSWLVVPVGIALTESLVGQSIFLPRNLLLTLPAVALLLAWGITRRSPLLAVPLLAALVALRALQVAPAYGVSPEDWRGATAYVLQRSQPGDCVAFYPSDGRNAFRYYLTGSAPRSVLPAVPWTNGRAYIEDYATLSGRPSGCRRLWLVSSHQGQPDGPAASRANRARYFALRAQLEGQYGHQGARNFGYAAPVTVQLFSGP